mgnify:CR=1 FL=1
MKKKLILILSCLCFAILLSSCFSAGTDYTLRVIPPENPTPPLQGTWKITSLLSPEAGNLAQDWVGKNIYFGEQVVLLDKYLISSPHFQIKKVQAVDYINYYKKAFPDNFSFQEQELEVLTLSSDQFFFCEFLCSADDELILHLFNHSYQVKKISAATGDLSAKLKTTEIKDISNLTETAKEKTGVLLGLRYDRQGQRDEQYRTLWLALTEDKSLAPVLQANTIIFPRKNGFYELQLTKVATTEAKEDFISAVSILGNNTPTTAPSLDPLIWEGKKGSIERKILFLSNDYLAVEETIRQTSKANNSKNEENKLKIIAIDSLPKMKAVKISDLINPGAAQAMAKGRQKLLSQLNFSKVSPQDETNLGLMRNKGYWMFMGRINYQQGSNTLTADYPLSVIPPAHLVVYDELKIPWLKIKNHVPNALDVFTAPNGNLALVVTQNEILVYPMAQGNLLDTPLTKIPLQENEQIIMAEWAVGHYVENWGLTFQTYLKQKNNSPAS